MKIDVPPGHKVGTEVPVGGSNCAKCRYLSQGGKRCAMTFWINTPKKDGGGGGDSALPKSADRYCCDFFEETKKSALRVTAKEVIRNG